MTYVAKLPVLYSFWRSSCSYRVRIALNLKRIEHTIFPVNILKREQDHNEFRAINPLGKVPAIVIDGHTIVESLNIMHYLEETRPEHPLMPTNVYEKSKVREICEMIQSGIQPLQNVGLLSHLESIAGKGERLKWAQHWINNGFRAVEKQLTANSGTYCVGNEITLADCCLIPQVFNAKMYHVDIKQYPTIMRISNDLETHPAFASANPLNQPDCDLPKNKKT